MSRPQAYETARQYCLKQWRHVLITNDDSGPETTDLYFRCVTTKPANGPTS